MLASTYAQLIAGVAVGLFILCLMMNILSLMMNSPFLQNALAAVAAAVIADFLVGKHSTQDAGSVIDRIAGEISLHPHFTLGLMLVATAALFRVLRAQ